MVPSCCGRQTLGQLLVSVLTFVLAAGIHRQGTVANTAAQTGDLQTGTVQQADAAAVLAEADAAEAKAATEAASASGIIPEWRLKETNGLPILKPRPLYYSYKVPLPAVASTPAQDNQRCPLLKIPDNITLAARGKSWYRLYGDIDTQDGLTIASWNQNLLTYDWRKVDIYNKADGSRTVRARILTDEEMRLVFAWQAPKPENGTTKSPLIAEFYPELKTTSNLALLDCDGRLNYVVTQEKEFPYGLTIYNAGKRLLAKTIVDTTIMRYQFVDPQNEYLIATAEAPEIGFLMGRSKLPRDPSLGMVPPMGIKFEKGGYTNSSRLMDIDYRWVIVAAVQVATINLAEQNWSPKEAQTALDVLWGLFFVVIGLSICYMLYYIYRTVFPPETVHSEHKLIWKGRAKDVTEVGASPFLTVPSLSSMRGTTAFQSPGYVDYRTMDPTGLHGN